MHFFDEVQIPQFSTSIPVRTWSFAGYKEFALHYWFRGQPGSKVYMEIYFNQLSGRREEIVITPGGISIAESLSCVCSERRGCSLQSLGTDGRADTRVRSLLPGLGKPVDPCNPVPAVSSTGPSDFR